MNSKNIILKAYSFAIAAVMLFVLLCGCDSKPQTSDYYLSDIPYTYPVLPGSAEWEGMTPSMRREACYVDRETSEQLSTEALLETILNYPFFGDFDAFNDPHTRLLEFAHEFPPLTVLLGREDAVEVVETYISNVEKYNANGEINLDWYDSRTILHLIETQSNSRGKTLRK